MKQRNANQKNQADDPTLDDQRSLTFRPLPSLTSIFHFVWLKKWVLFAVWLGLAIPTGILLSIFNLPKSYVSTTVLRFPSVVGAQTNVMRDVGITQEESIISTVQSFQVLEGTVRKLGLRLRINTSGSFLRGTFKSLNYSDNLGPGTYFIHWEGGSRIKIRYRPKPGNTEYDFFQGSLTDDKFSSGGLDFEIIHNYWQASGNKLIELELTNLEECILDLKKSLDIRSLGGSNFEVRLKDRDPQMVAEILNTLRKEFLEVYYGTTEVQDVRILVQMEKDLELAKKKLETSQDDLSKYYGEHPELVLQAAPTQGDNLTYLEARQQVESLQQNRNRVQVAMAAKDPSAVNEKKFFWASELLQAMSQAGEPKANIYRGSLAELNSRQMEFRGTLGPNHPRILEVEQEKEQLYLQMEETQAELMRRIDKELGAAKIKMAGSAPVSARQVPIKIQLELERLNSVNTNNQQIYERLQESYNRAKLTTGSEFFKVTVVDPARPALYKPPSLKTRLLIAISAVMLLAFTVSGAFACWPLIFIKIWTKEDIAKLLGLRVLGAVGQHKPVKQVRTKGEPEPIDEPGGRIKGKPDPLLLYMGDSYRLEDVESYRIIREEVENTFRNPARPGKYCLMLTSSHPAEGKSTSAANLAMTFARKGKRTLLLDADLRLGRLHSIFNIEVHTGIDDILNQEDFSLKQFLESSALAFQVTSQPNLVIAPRKNPSPNAGELVSSDRFKALIKMVRDEFDVVLIDTPPVMITPEPLSIAEVTDGVIFVCRSGVTSASEAREAISTLQDRKVTVAVILNGVKDTVFHRSRYKKYSYYYAVQGLPGNTPPA